MLASIVNGKVSTGPKSQARAVVTDSEAKEALLSHMLNPGRSHRLWSFCSLELRFPRSTVVADPEEDSRRTQEAEIFVSKKMAPLGYGGGRTMLF